MKVVFLENFSEAWYLAWDIREVKDWFARNFLIPKKVALPATEKIVAETEDLRKKWEEIREAAKKAAQDTKTKLSWKTLKLNWKADWDTLYAAITEKMIVDKIKLDFGVELEEKFVKDWHIKTLWAHQINIIMTDWISVVLKVEISDDTQKAKVEKKEEKVESEEEAQTEE
jgi:large subunit ribosomal protein L9